MIAWVANQMCARGYDAELIALYSNEVNQPLDEGVHFHSLNLGQSKSRLVRNTIGIARGLIKLNRYIRKSKPDVVVLFIDSLGYMYLPINRLFSRSKTLVSERVDPNLRKGLLAKIQSRLLNYADAFAFQTEGAMACFSNKIKSRSVVIPNPVAPKSNVAMGEICAYKERENRIVTVGRLELKQKRQDILIKAFKRVREQYPELRLEIFGDGEDQAQIESLIEELDLKDAVYLAGKTNQVEQDIYKAKLFVLSSDYEGIPNALLEAMSVGLPCVTTDCSPGGARLLINDRENGLIVGRGEVEELARAICYMLENPKESQQMGVAAQQSLSRFAPELVADKWEEVIIAVNEKRKKKKSQGAKAE